jgi:DNA-binding GntR family transcriptional regulator
MIATRTLKQRAYSHLRRKILAREFAGDGRVSEWAVSRELAMSRGPIREAINQLLSEGLLRQQPGLGTFVRVPTREDLEQLADIRLALEVLAAGKAARRITTAQAMRLERFCSQMEVIGREVLAGTRKFEGNCLEAMFEADHGIHATVLEAARAPLIGQMLRTTSAMSLIRQQSPASLARQVRDMPDHLAIHRGIVDAVIARDAKASRRLMREHLSYVRRDVLTLFDLEQSACRAVAMGS